MRLFEGIALGRRAVRHNSVPRRGLTYQPRLFRGHRARDKSRSTQLRAPGVSQTHPGYFEGIALGTKSRSTQLRAPGGLTNQPRASPWGSDDQEPFDTTPCPEGVS